MAALKAISQMDRRLDIGTRGEFIKRLDEARRVLSAARPTEPLTRNALKYVFHKVKSTPSSDITKLRAILAEASHEFLGMLKATRRAIATIGARRVLNGSRILTHCHSTAVMDIFRQARQDGKKFEVICTETRPLYQGRITARQLITLGIKTTMIADSAVRFYIRGVDFVLTGIDAITSEGAIINKIGTSLIALAAQEARVPFYAVGEIFKFSPETVYGEYEEIEEREPTELWPRAPRGLIIRNPAFDITRTEFVHGIICELGIIPPILIQQIVRDRYPWIIEEV
jgi:ribose 1,5-bisphosphate isomerase